MTQDINLYDDSLKAVRDLLSLPTVLIAMLVCLIGVLGGYLLARSRLDEASQQLAQREQTLTRLREALLENSKALAAHATQSELQQQLDAQQAQFRRMRNAASQIQAVLKDQTQPFAQVLKGLATRNAEGIWLEKIEISRGARLTLLEGQATHESLIPDYIAGLHREAALSGLSFAHLSVQGSSRDAASDASRGTTDGARRFLLSSQSPSRPGTPATGGLR